MEDAKATTGEVEELARKVLNESFPNLDMRFRAAEASYTGPRIWHLEMYNKAQLITVFTIKDEDDVFAILNLLRVALLPVLKEWKKGQHENP